MQSTHLQSFLARSLEKILKERDIKKSYHADLRTCCESVLEELKKDTDVGGEGDSVKSPSASAPSALPLPPSATPAIIPEHYFLPFEKACTSRSPKIVCTALDCLQKLIAYGHLSNTVSKTGIPSNDVIISTTHLLNRLVEAICSCFTGPTTDEGVQLQIIKALLTIVTSPHISVHEGTVLLTIRTVYNIYLASKSSINSTTAKGTLSQMLSVIYIRMESEDYSEIKKTLEETQVSMASSGIKIEDEDETRNGELVPPRDIETELLPVNSDDGVANGGDTDSLKCPSDSGSFEFDNASLDAERNSEVESQPQRFVNGDVKGSDGAPDETTPSPVQQNTTISETLDKIVNGDDVEERGAGSVEYPVVCTSSESESKPNEAQSMVKNETVEDDVHRDCDNGEPVQESGSEVEPQSVVEVAVNGDGDVTRSVGPPTPVGPEDPVAIELRSVEGKERREKPLSRIPSEESLTSNGLETPSDSTSYVLQPTTTTGSTVCTTMSHPPVPAFNHILQKDAFLIFRALCKLSMKPLPENSPNDPKSHELRSKILSLQLLLSIVQEPGQVFKTNPVFITAVKQYLCISLKKNGLSSVPTVFELSMKIFVQLLIHFRAHLRSQIESFFRDVIFPLLECSSLSPLKLLTLNSLIVICSSAQIIVDLYLNYDCDLGSVNIFERLVNDLSKIATLESELRIDGIRGLVGILQCMDEWSRPKADVEQVVIDNPVQFEVMKSHKNTWEQGLFLFNRKPSEGLKFLQSNTLLGETPSEIANFFHTDDRVDKVAIGEYLGDPDAMHKQVMHAYVDQFNFKDQDFVTALRFFLQGFRLPGEAQKIDRLMEKFASRYCECNPTNGIFTSADTAYVLAYSIIMLTTDLHSPQVKTKMTKEQYVRMNRGINDSRDLPESYLSGIYDEIAGNEIKMKNFSKKALASSGAGGLVRPGNNEKEEQNFTEGKHLEHIRPMFKLAWTPFLASFSVGLQDSNEQNISTLCLEGIRLAIHIACIFAMRLERDAYIQALARFTLLNTTSLTEMKSKNINSIKTLIIIGQLEGNYLDTAWLDILKAISSLELAQLVGTRSKDFSNSGTGGLSGLKSFTLLESQSHAHSQNPMMINLNHLDPSVKESITSTSSQSILVAVDRIFTGSTLLDGDSIVHFVRALCTVSLDELTSNHPRMFSLQKMVEISYYNMSRIRLEWSRIWEVLGDHFNHVGCLTDDIAFFAIDSLRQLSMKFIEKGEFTNFRFQKDFLRPFEYIMKKNSSPSIRDMIVRCISQMIHQSAKIRSGWKNIFSVLSFGANDLDPNIVEMCFITTNKIVGELYSSNPTILLDSFQNGIKCLSEFACNTNYPDISMESIRLIRYCATFVDQTPDLLVECMDELNIPHGDRVWVRGWFPILFELSCIIGRCNLDVRTRGLTVMFEIIKTYGSAFQPHWWKDLFQVIFRIFDNMKLPEQLNEKKEWMTTTCNHALFAIIDVFTQYYDILGPLLMDELFKQLQWCIEGDPSCQLSISAIHCLEHLVLSNGSKFNPGVWKSTVEFLKGIAEWMASQESRAQGTKGKKTTKQLSFPNELILTIDNIVFYQSNGSRANEDKSTTPDYNQEQGMYPYLNDHNLLTVLDTLQYFGQEPVVLLDAINTSMRLLFRIYEDPLQARIHPQIERRLLTLNTKILQNPKWTGLLSLSLQKINQLTNEKFQIHTTLYYPVICDLVTVDILEPEVKRLLKDYFVRVGCVYSI